MAFFKCLINALARYSAGVAIPFRIPEPSTQPVLQPRVELAVLARFGEVRVRLVEDLPRLGRVAFKPTLRLLIVRIVGDVGGWFVCGFERAFAVPAVARAVFVPKRVVDGTRQLDRLKPLVLGFGVGRCGRHPAQVRHDVAVMLKLQPVRRNSALNKKNERKRTRK